MPGIFHAVGAFELKARNHFVVFGNVAEGEVRKGMRLLVPLNRSVALEQSIAAVESVLKEGISYVALCLEITDPLEMQLWSGLGINDEQLEVLEA